ncbi:hypothetical protein NQ314_015977 [Rhamnusium bicolor]|uniref:Transforming acidic coiled-coil-containing protein C-terminal domain-containing protein n=1 Tax=Rhamnusium bicolor TaxID=1586634 RepID=A0AAV8WWR8_9CUCU|nr:hypothetical protein NQ314_015977 [Rhamnusium bicolor]
MEIFRLQEPISVELLTKKKKLGQYKDVLQKNNVALMKELERQVRELEMKNKELENHIRYSDLDESEFESMMRDYEVVIKKIWGEQQVLMYENTRLRSHAGYLESSFGKLLEKYEEAKNIVREFEKNEGSLKKELELYNEVIKKLENNYKSFKDYAESRIAEVVVEDSRNKSKDSRSRE